MQKIIIINTKEKYLIIKIFLLFLFFIESLSAMQERVLINDTFSNNKNNWELFDDSISTTGFATVYGNQQYSIRNRTENLTSIFKKFNQINTNYFTIETTVFHVFSIDNHSYFGLLFGAKDSDNGYFFGISDKKKYIIYKVLNGKKIILAKSKKFKSKKFNKLTIKKNNNRIYFIINGNILEILTGNKLYGNNIGFFVENKQKIYFDDFNIVNTNKNSLTFNKYATLNINAPKYSKIKILNIKNTYKTNMLLPKRKYHVQVSKKGFNTFNKWIVLSGNKTINITLTKYKAIKSAILVDGWTEWSDTRNKFSLTNLKYVNNLFWSNKISKKRINWNGAKNYCRYLSIKSNGIIFKNFRLPTKDELYSPLKYDTLSFDIGRKLFFTNTISSIYKNEVIILSTDGQGHIKKDNLHNNAGSWNTDPIHALCVTNNFNSIQSLANGLLNGVQKHINKLHLTKKPKLVKYKKLIKDEFETTHKYNMRVQKSNKNIDLQNEQIVKKWHEKNKTEEKEHKQKIQQLKNNKKSKYLQLLQEAIHIKYGSPIINTIEYNADKEVFKINIKSTRGQYNKTVNLPVNIKYAKKFKQILINKNFKPTIEFKVKNSQLVFSGIKEIKDPEIIVEESEYKKAYSIYNKLKSISLLQVFIHAYPNSSFVPSAKDRIARLNEKIKIEKEKERIRAEKERIRAERERIRAEKAQKRKNDSFYAKKQRGDKVCKDGTMAIFMSITITAYVENVNGDNIQLRIADTEGTTPYVKGVRLYRNTLIWDDYTNWYKCNY